MSVRTVLLAMLAAAPGVAPIPALSQDRPATTPTRDVDVTYRATAGDQAVEQRSRWSAETRKMRLDTPTPGVYLIVDYAQRRMSMVNDAERAVLDLPPPPDGLLGAAEAGSYIRRGPGQVAGLGCTNWETLDTDGKVALACFTDDGVLLEARRGAQVLVQAVRVAYGRLDGETFTVPPAYAHETPRFDKPGNAR